MLKQLPNWRLSEEHFPMVDDAEGYWVLRGLPRKRALWMAAASTVLVISPTASGNFTIPVWSDLKSSQLFCI